MWVTSMCPTHCLYQLHTCTLLYNTPPGKNTWHILSFFPLDGGGSHRNQRSLALRSTRRHDAILDGPSHRTANCSVRARSLDWIMQQNSPDSFIIADIHSTHWCCRPDGENKIKWRLLWPDKMSCHPFVRDRPVESAAKLARFNLCNLSYTHLLCN